MTEKPTESFLEIMKLNMISRMNEEDGTEKRRIEDQSLEKARPEEEGGEGINIREV